MKFLKAAYNWREAVRDTNLAQHESRLYRHQRRQYVKARTQKEIYHDPPLTYHEGLLTPTQPQDRSYSPPSDYKGKTLQPPKAKRYWRRKGKLMPHTDDVKTLQWRKDRLKK